MSDTFKVACVQNCAGPDMGANLDASEELVRAARSEGAELICLPEYFSCLELTDDGLNVGPMSEKEHPALLRLGDLARELKAWILLGSLAILSNSGKIYNRSYLINADGKVAAEYDKIHLFDVDLKNGESYRESAMVEVGERAVLAPTPWGLMGMSVCYDLRFAYLYRTLAQGGAGFLAVPAAFMKTTGQAHWHVLLRSRAIETGSYVFAPCQAGSHGKAETYGHSLIIDPWGKVLADAGCEVGFVTAEVDLRLVAESRNMIPALEHDRAFAGAVARFP